MNATITAFFVSLTVTLLVVALTAVYALRRQNQRLEDRNREITEGWRAERRDILEVVEEKRR